MNKKLTLVQVQVNKLREESLKSEICHKHACIAMVGNKPISPAFHNYMRSYFYNFNCVSMHAEMAVINYLINYARGSLYPHCKKKQSCIL
jgi:hypothetical protein